MSPRQRQRRLSPAQSADLVAGYEAGSTLRELAARFQVHRTTALDHVKRAGVALHSEHGKWDDATLTEATTLYERGDSLATIGRRYGVNAKTVAFRLRAGGIQLRPRRGSS